MMSNEERKDYDQTMKNIAQFLSIATIGEPSPSSKNHQWLFYSDEIKLLADAYLKLAKAGLIREMNPDKATMETLEQL